METGAEGVAGKAVGGLLGLTQGIVISNLKDVNVVLQTVSLALGIIIAIAAIWALFRRKKTP